MVYEISISIDESVHTVMILLSQRINMTMLIADAESQQLTEAVGIWNLLVILLTYLFRLNTEHNFIKF